MSRHWQAFMWPAIAATGLVAVVSAISLAVLLPRSSDAAPPGDATTIAGPTRGSAGDTTLAPGLTSPAATPGAATTATTAATSAKAPARFATSSPGAALPSGAQCATWVRATPYKENKGANARANATTGHHIGATFFGAGDDARADRTIGPRVDGNFTGTTRQILRWAACKWGIDEDLVFAQAAVESWWQQNTLGDWTDNAANCAPDRGPGVDGQAGRCPESFGILQNRYPYEKTAWPGIANSTAMNADLGYAIFRVCFEGYERWLNTVNRGQEYTAGDTWGCVGRWFSGRWHTPESDGYVQKVRDYLNRRVWETPDFQQP